MLQQQTRYSTNYYIINSNNAMEKLRLLVYIDNEYILQNNLLKATNDILFVAGGPRNIISSLWRLG